MNGIISPSTAASVAERVYDIRKLNTFSNNFLIDFRDTRWQKLNSLTTMLTHQDQLSLRLKPKKQYVRQTKKLKQQTVK